jgi:DNA-nicking Smr family endonuclease
MAKPRPRSTRHDPTSRERAAGLASTAGDTPEADDEPHPEAAIFRAAVGDVRPMPPTDRAPAGAARIPRRRSAASRRRADLEHDLPLLPESVASDEAVGGSEALSFRRPGVRDQEMRKLRRGLYAIEGELDLHGLNQAAARDSLREFLEYARAAGHRCVRIVHGKGYRSGARGPILKIAVNAWLRQHPYVVAFTSARSIDGGTGAVYVLLRA